MTFELTDSLKTNLLAALENQEKSFLVSAKSGELLEIGAVRSIQDNEENFYSLPEWTSEHGFKLREDFVEQLHSPVAHDELLAVLHSGRGVFRNFRNVLREYPEIDRLWLKYKNQRLLEIINDWYNGLREIWGLEKLDYLPESDESLVHDDFSFSEFNPELHEKLIEKYIEQNANFLNGSDDSLPEEINSAIQGIWKKQFEIDKTENQSGFICNSLTDEFVGCILVKPVSGVQKNVILLTNFFVTERYRGLGIGTELLSMCVSKLKSAEKKWLILPNIIIPKIIEPLLLRTGFKKIDFGYLLAL